MKKKDALKWASWLCPDMEGRDEPRYRKNTGSMFCEVTNSACCLGVCDFALTDGHSKHNYMPNGKSLEVFNVTTDKIPKILNVPFPDINDDGYPIVDDQYSNSGRPMTHPEIGTLLLFAIESGEYKKI